MAAKTSVFYLTERVELNAGATIVADTIDLGAYVDVADRQGILVHSVDFVFQGWDTAANEVAGIQAVYNTDATIFAQLTDLNRGGIVLADDRALIASGQLLVDDSNNALDSDSDLYPDNFGPTSAMGGRIVINDQMYFRARSFGTYAADRALQCIVRIKCSVITLSQKDFMAIALQSTAADN
jgi:hypothetical protein